MTKTSPAIIFFGNERLSTAFDPHGAPTLEALIHAGYNIKAVVSNFEQGRSRKARKLEIQAVAEKHDIPVFLPDRPVDIEDTLRNYNAECAVLVAYGRIIPQRIIDIFPKGIINIHPSLLPQYRGPIPIEQAILDGATETGVSLMQLVKEMDAGPIYAQTKIALTGNETKDELTQKLLALGGHMLVTHLPAILNGTLIPTAQDETKASYTQLLAKESGKLDANEPATRLERKVRAFAGWPKATLKLGEHQVIIRRARVAHHEADGALVVPCGNKTYLELLELTAPSGRTMSGSDFLRGYLRHKA